MLELFTSVTGVDFGRYVPFVVIPPLEISFCWDCFKVEFFVLASASLVLQA